MGSESDAWLSYGGATGAGQILLESTEIILRGAVPVSYTHLDVYKRQDLECRRHSAIRANLPEPAQPPGQIIRRRGANGSGLKIRDHRHAGRHRRVEGAQLCRGLRQPHLPRHNRAHVDAALLDHRQQRRIAPAWHAAVSYTHLDVYKRQVIDNRHFHCPRHQVLIPLLLFLCPEWAVGFQTPRRRFRRYARSGDHQGR